MKKLFIHNILFRIFAPVLTGTTAYLLTLLVFNNLSYLRETFLNQELYLIVIITFLIFEGNRVLTILLEKRSPFEENNYRSILLQFSLSSVLSVVLTTLSLHVYFRYIEGASVFSTVLFTINAIFLFVSWLYTMAYFSNRLLYQQNIEQLEAERSMREAIEKELSTYKNEVNPDLLYNGLETLITLVHKDPIEAEEFIDELSLVYRYILTNRQNELIDLEEDLEAAENVVRILNYRNEGLINLSIKINEEDRQMQIIPGTIPGLVEYITRRTIINPLTPLSIVLSKEESGYINLYYQINERLLPDNFETNIIAKLQNSYSYFSDRPLVVVKAEKDCYVKIPVMELSTEDISL